MADAGMEQDDQPIRGGGKRKQSATAQDNSVRAGGAGETNGAGRTQPSTRSKRKSTGANLPPFIIVDDAPYMVAGDDDTLAPPGEELDIDGMGDLDATERFDLGDTLSRSGGLRGESLVELLDEAFDNLALEDVISEDTPAKAERTVHASAALNTLIVGVVAEDAEDVEDLDEANSLEAAKSGPGFEENEPDVEELAKVVATVEAERPEELERFIDRALTMEGVSVDDSVRIYLREIGRTSLLKSPDESALAEKMTQGRKAASELESYKAKMAEIAALSITLAELMGDANTLSKDLVEKYKACEAQIQTLQAEVLAYDDSYVRDLETTKRSGDNSKQILVQANLRLVVSIARRYIGRGLSLLDLVQEGNIGLMKAADKFDHRKGFKFSTYATWWIRQAITRAISDQSRTIRLPVHVTEMVTKLRRAAHELQQQLLREPTEEELGAVLGMPAERVRRILDMARHPASLDAPMEEGEDSFLGDFIEDESTGAPEEEASRQMLKEQVEDILSKLTERERKILEMRYGLADDRPRTLEEVAREFNITRERIRQIETRILRKLRYARYGASKLKGYLD